MAEAGFRILGCRIDAKFETAAWLALVRADTTFNTVITLFNGVAGAQNLPITLTACKATEAPETVQDQGSIVRVQLSMSVEGGVSYALAGP